MAKAKEVNEAQVAEVEVKPSGEALADAVAQGKEVSDHVTDLTNAKEVTEVGGTVIVRW